jgi:hypothetical protein
VIAFVLVEARLFKCFLLEFTFLPPGFAEDFELEVWLDFELDVWLDFELDVWLDFELEVWIDVPENPNIAHTALTRYSRLLSLCSSVIRFFSTLSRFVRIFLLKYRDA